MREKGTRRSFLKHSAAAVAALQGPAPATAAKARARYLCVTCGTQFRETEGPPASCPICEDERQYVGWDGQQWTTLEKMRGKYRNVLKEEERGLHSVLTQPHIGIGQRAFVVRTPKGNLLWDCVPLLDGATVKAVKALGGLAGVAVSHPHYYTSMVEWSHAFGKVPVHLHKADAKWVMRPDPVVAAIESAGAAGSALMEDLPGGGPSRPRRPHGRGSGAAATSRPHRAMPA